MKILAAGGIITALGGGYHWLSKDRDHAHLSIELVLNRLNSLDLENTESSGTWGVTRTLNHLTQSIEFSMSGYPEMKSKLFRDTAGKLAFSLFQANGRMKHGLDEEIPGEMVELNNSNSIQARNRLIESLERFDEFGQSLRPHFAYGELSKAQYARAHVMHVNNHLEEFRTV